MISPAGLEELFRAFGAIDGEPDPDRITELAARHGCEVDMDATFPIVERHGLAF